MQPALYPAPRRAQEFSCALIWYLPRFGFRRPRALRRLPQYPNNDPSQRRHEHIAREDNRQNKSPARAHVSANICGCVSAASVKNALHQDQPLLQCSISQEEKQFCSVHPWWPEFQSAICGYYEVDFRPLTGSGQSALSVIGRFDVRHCFSGVGYMIQIRRHFLFSTPI
jgi:hypothetical protein